MDNKLTVFQGQIPLQVPLADDMYMEKSQQEKLEIYKNLIVENNSLRVQLTAQTVASNVLINELTELKAKNQILLDNLHDKDELNQQIKILLGENESLRNQIYKLKETIVNQNTVIEKLENNIEELNGTVMNQKVIIVNLENYNAGLNDRVKKLEDKQLFDKYLIAIQDVNRYDELELNVPSIKKNLKKLRSFRVDECHYLNEEEDDARFIDEKRSVLLEKVNNMSGSVRNMFNKKFPGLLTGLLPYIATNVVVPSKDSQELIDDWWE